MHPKASRSKQAIRRSELRLQDLELAIAGDEYNEREGEREEGREGREGGREGERARGGGGGGGGRGREGSCVHVYVYVYMCTCACVYVGRMAGRWLVATGRFVDTSY